MCIPDHPTPAAGVRAPEGIEGRGGVRWLGRSDTRAVSTRTSNIEFGPKPDARGYWTTTDGRWKAKNHRVKGQPRSVTLTDTTRRAIFADTGASWTRVSSWDAVRDMIATHG